jgi:hypothetical protein
MQIHSEIQKFGEDIKIHRVFDATGTIVGNNELRKEIGDGFTKEREMRHIMRIPVYLSDCDPLVAAALKGDKVCRRLAIAKYPFIKVCDGNV